MFRGYVGFREGSAWKTSSFPFGIAYFQGRLLLVSGRVRPCLVIFGWPRILSHTHLKEHQEILMKKKRDAFGGGFHRLQGGISRDNRAYQPYMDCKSYM